jgi:hypothetical protein
MRMRLYYEDRVHARSSEVAGHLLLSSERDQRIDACGTPRGHEAGDERQHPYQ